MKFIVKIVLNSGLAWFKIFSFN